MQKRIRRALEKGFPSPGEFVAEAEEIFECDERFYEKKGINILIHFRNKSR
jgi:hypothetical protein